MTQRDTRLQTLQRDNRLECSTFLKRQGEKLEAFQQDIREHYEVILH